MTVGGGGRSAAVRRAARVLSELAIAPESLSIADLARRTNTPKSSLTDVGSVLVDTGMLARDRDGGLRLGSKVAQLARGLVGGTPLLELFHGAARRRQPREQTLVLAVLLDLDTAYIAVEPGGNPLPLTLKVGMRLPAWSTGTGRALLAALSDEEAQTLHQDAPPVSPSGRPFEMDELMEALAAARRHGYASNTEIGEMQVTGTAALVHHHATPIAAVGSISPQSGRDNGDGKNEGRADIDLVRRLASELTTAIRDADRPAE